MILNHGELSGGTLATRKFAQQLAKPFLVNELDGTGARPSPSEAAQWLAVNAIRTLNVAGPRESKCPGVYLNVYAFLAALQACVDEGTAHSLIRPSIGRSQRRAGAGQSSCCTRHKPSRPVRNIQPPLAISSAHHVAALHPISQRPHGHPV